MSVQLTKYEFTNLQPVLYYREKFSKLEHYENYLPLPGPTFGTYDELAVIAESGIPPDSIPRGKSHSSVTNKK